jgi:hypothetical protein
MINPKTKHTMLRLDLLESFSIEVYPTKTFYKYSENKDYSKGFLFENCVGRIIIEKDCFTKQLLFERAFFDEIKNWYLYSSLLSEDEFVKNELEIFFSSNIDIVNTNNEIVYNPIEFEANQYQVKSISELDDYTNILWERINNQF